MCSSYLYITDIDVVYVRCIIQNQSNLILNETEFHFENLMLTLKFRIEMKVQCKLHCMKVQCKQKILIQN